MLKYAKFWGDLRCLRKMRNEDQLISLHGYAVSKYGYIYIFMTYFRKPDLKIYIYFKGKDSTFTELRKL